MFPLSRPTPIPRAPLPRPGQSAAPNPTGLPYTLPLFLVNVAWIGIAQDIGEPQLIPLAIDYAGPRYTAQWLAVGIDPTAPWASFIRGLLALYPEILPTLDPQKLTRLQRQIGRLLLEDLGHDAALTADGFCWMDDILLIFAVRLGLPYRAQDSLAYNFTKIALSTAFRRLRDLENHVGLRTDGPMPDIPGPNIFRDLPPHLARQPRARLTALNLQRDNFHNPPAPNHPPEPAPPRKPRPPHTRHTQSPTTTRWPRPSRLLRPPPLPRSATRRLQFPAGHHHWGGGVPVSDWVQSDFVTTPACGGPRRRQAAVGRTRITKQRPKRTSVGEWIDLLRHTACGRPADSLNGGRTVLRLFSRPARKDLVNRDEERAAGPTGVRGGTSTPTGTAVPVQNLSTSLGKQGERHEQSADPAQGERAVGHGCP
ncbi:hypothetical protein DFH11DRAFT_1550138 [Phellopilus nigrolimitatus]|nr:hypothetical protein DFH11DRAFT_1550138 [Phellopilus nigrolimitatus]